MADCDGLRGRGGLVRWCSLRLADGGSEYAGQLALGAH